MKSLIQQALLLLQEAKVHGTSLLATEEERLYFQNHPLLPRSLPSPNRSQLSLHPGRLAPSLPSPQTTSSVSQDQLDPEHKVMKKHPIDSSIIQKHSSSSLNDKELKTLLEKILPHITLRDNTPHDAVAKKMENLWNEAYLQSNVVILFFDEKKEEISFLKNVCSAIHSLIMPASLVSAKELEQENGFELLLKNSALEWVICPPLQQWKTTPLAHYYRQNSATQEQFLDKKSLFLLDPLDSYLHHPQQKKILWKSLNTHLLSSISPSLTR
ncbi:MAG: hypothetical protein QRY72_02340 [Candidatus Rhabdochlamydia sp.]